MKGDRSAPPVAKIFDGRPKEEHLGAPYGRPKIEEMSALRAPPKCSAPPPRGGGGGDRYATACVLCQNVLTLMSSVNLKKPRCV